MGRICRCHLKALFMPLTIFLLSHHSWASGGLQVSCQIVHWSCFFFYLQWTTTNDTQPFRYIYRYDTASTVPFSITVLPNARILAEAPLENFRWDSYHTTAPESFQSKQITKMSITAHCTKNWGFQPGYRADRPILQMEDRLLDPRHEVGNRYSPRWRPTRWILQVFSNDGAYGDLIINGSLVDWLIILLNELVPVEELEWRLLPAQQIELGIQSCNPAWSDLFVLMMILLERFRLLERGEGLAGRCEEACHSL